jgi:EAL domain-containing protein (putative c-di-GMP-specific phosphodiesterase class I)
MKFDNFSFFGQSINDVDNGKIESYELLLRGTGEGNAFPQKSYISFLSDHEKHVQYMKWLRVELEQLFSEHPTMEFSINLDHQELEYEETYDFLRSLTDHTDQLTIEITEVSPIQRFNNYFSTIHVAAVKRIYDLGFRIALDDVGQGVNSFGNLLQVKNYIYRIKFSTLHFTNDIDSESLKRLILFFDSAAKEMHKDFVIEGVEDQEFAQWLKDNVSSFHQGYLYERPHEIAECMA